MQFTHLMSITCWTTWLGYVLSEGISYKNNLKSQMTMYSRTHPFLMPPFLGTCKDKKRWHLHQLKKRKRKTKSKLKNAINMNNHNKNRIKSTMNQTDSSNHHFFRNTGIYLGVLVKSSSISSNETNYNYDKQDFVVRCCCYCVLCSANVKRFKPKYEGAF